jgi:hypothetical protein
MANNDGESQTLSPFAPNFWNHIEPGIAPLVEAFVNKNYLPYSSCEGHSIFGRRFVALAFPDKKTCRKLADELRQVNTGILSFKIKHITDYYHNAFKYGERDIPKEVGWLNSIYLRGYQDYYFLEVSIGDNSPPKIKNWALIFKKMLYRDYTTSALVCLVENFVPMNEN